MSPAFRSRKEKGRRLRRPYIAGISMMNFSIDEKGQLTLAREGEEVVADVRVRRAFPWSNPDHFVSLRTSEGKELALIDDLAALSPEQQSLLRARLDRSTFIPRITRVLEVDVQFGYQQWRVDTDRGPIAFRVQEREDIRFLADGRFTVKDADGSLYELPPLESLDESSRRAVDALI